MPKLALILLIILAVPSPAVSSTGDIGRLAYTSDRDGNNEVYSARVDGAGEANLSNNPATDQYPAWSADGSRIAFVSDRGGRMDVWVMNWDGSDQRQVTSGDPSSSDSEPSWSPDGNRIVFSSSRGDGSWHLWTVDLQGGSLRRLTPGWGVSPAWSPNGSSIAYDGGGEIRMVDPDGAGDRQLTGCGCTGAAGSPTWSPDSSFLVFGRYDDDWQTTNIRQLYFIRATGGEALPITSGVYYHGHPGISPDGSMLVFQRQNGVLGSPELYYLRLSDGLSVPSVTGPGRNFVPSWGPSFAAPPPPPPPPADTTPPTITITRPTSSGTDRIDVYTVGQLVLADYSCSDAGSGVRHCMGPVESGAPLDTSSVGTFEFRVFAADQTGNPIYRSAQYRVVFPFTGFDHPVADDGWMRTAAGDGTPLKFSLGGNYGLEVVTSLRQQPLDCASHEATGPALPAAGKLSYNTSQDRYKEVWASQRSWEGSCRAVFLDLSDGTSHRADVRFTK